MITILASAVLGQLDLACYRKLKRLCDSATPRLHRGLAAASITVFFAAALFGLN